eukprot:364262-Chlamydomonas_euryale.AAC.3
MHVPHKRCKQADGRRMRVGVKLGHAATKCAQASRQASSKVHIQADKQTNIHTEKAGIQHACASMPARSCKCACMYTCMHEAHACAHKHHVCMLRHTYSCAQHLIAGHGFHPDSMSADAHTLTQTPILRQLLGVIDDRPRRLELVLKLDLLALAQQLLRRNLAVAGLLVLDLRGPGQPHLRVATRRAEFCHGGSRAPASRRLQEILDECVVHDDLSAAAACGR